MTVPLVANQGMIYPTSARYIAPTDKQQYNVWAQLPKNLQGLDTRVIYIGPDGWLFNLAGRDAGKQGVRLATQMKGDYHFPFDLIMTEGAYQMGATIERVNYLKREIEFGTIIGSHANNMNSYQYRVSESYWWDQQDPDRDGWLGIYTRFTGWRWTRVRIAQTVDTPLKQDPAAMQNNVAQWDVKWVATKPWFAKPALYDTFYASKSVQGTSDPDVVESVQGSGTITLANRGTMMAYVKYLVNGHGNCTIQDNASNRMVALPEILPTDGVVLCDTDPEERTLVSSLEPVDNIFYQIIRSSAILDAYLSNIGDEGEQIWQRFQQRFMYSVPPQTVCSLSITHDNPEATVTAIMPQHYRRSR